MQTITVSVGDTAYLLFQNTYKLWIKICSLKTIAKK